MNNKIFILNGSGGVGKDTFVDFIKEFISSYHYSSVTKVKLIANQIGWSGGKTEKDRKFLSDLKLLTTDYCDMSFVDIKEYVTFFNNNYNNSLLFIDIREPVEIKRAVNEFGAKTILITSNRVEKITSNMADENVDKFKYDEYIKNDGSLDDLKTIAKDFVKKITNLTYDKNELLCLVCGHQPCKC